MAKRMDVSAPRTKKDGGVYWVKIGTAWFNDSGSIQIVFDALPLPDAEGRCVANLFEPKQDGGRQAAPRQQGRGGYADDDSSVPF